MIKTAAVAFTGASGLPYGLRLLECLLRAGVDVWLTYSQAARSVAALEQDLNLPAAADAMAGFFGERFGATPGRLRVFGIMDWRAPMASGSNPPDAMVVCPCSMTTLAKIASGLGDDLIARSADVALKERRKLILVPRETPLSTIHLENMLRVSRAGGIILPPCPGFYHRPASVDAMVDFVVARILDQLGVAHDLLPRWGEARVNDLTGANEVSRDTES